jgi:hypothetical protein
MAERAFPAASVPSAGAGLITSPFQFYVGGEDNLRVRVWDGASGQTLVVGVRSVDSSGAVQVTNESIVLSGTYTAQTRILKLNPGAVLSVAAEVIGGLVQRGQCFVQVDLVRGYDGPLVTIGTLLQGYAGTFMGLAYPGSPIIGPLEGPGYVRIIDGALPAPGANIAEVAPPRAVAHLLAFSATLTTSVVAGNRSVMLFLQDSATKIWWRAPSLYVQGPGLTVGYSWQPGMTLDDRKPNTAVANPLPWPHRLMGQAIRTAVVAGDVGDQWSAPQYVVEEWINPWI